MVVSKLVVVFLVIDSSSGSTGLIVGGEGGLF